MREEAETLFRTLRAGKMSIPLGRDEREQDYNHELYNWGTPREYHPSLNQEQSSELADITDSVKEVESTPDIRSMHSIPDIGDLNEALVQMREVFAEDHPDIVRLSTAVRVLGTIPESARHAAGVIADEINQAIDQVTERIAREMEPDPSPMQNDPYAIAQSTFDQQMQYMANPLMIPGTMLRPAPGIGI